MQTKILLTCDDVLEANLIKGRLHSEGNPCFLTNENYTNLTPHHRGMIGSGIQLIVHSMDYDRAIQVLEINNTQNSFVKCPDCSSENVQLKLGKNKFRKIISLIISVFAIIPVNNMNNVYYCKDCKTEFKVGDWKKIRLWISCVAC